MLRIIDVAGDMMVYASFINCHPWHSFYFLRYRTTSLLLHIAPSFVVEIKIKLLSIIVHKDYIRVIVVPIFKLVAVPSDKDVIFNISLLLVFFIN
jgi:hypothetical protein